MENRVLGSRTVRPTAMSTYVGEDDASIFLNA